MKSIKVRLVSKKVVSFFSGKIVVTPLVAAPGVTHPSDATDALQLEAARRASRSVLFGQICTGNNPAVAVHSSKRKTF